MKYIVLLTLSFYSAFAMQQTPTKSAGSVAEALTPDEQILKFQERVQAVKERQMATVGRIATEINERLPDNSGQSVLITPEQIMQVTPATFAATMSEMVAIKLESNIKETIDAVKTLQNSHSALMDFKNDKTKWKKLDPVQTVEELLAFGQTKHAIDTALKKIIELQYYLEIYYAEEQNKPTKPPLVKQTDE